MVVLTERAAEAVRQFQEDQDRIGAGLRVTVTKANGGMTTHWISRTSRPPRTMCSNRKGSGSSWIGTKRRSSTI